MIERPSSLRYLRFLLLNVLVWAHIWPAILGLAGCNQPASYQPPLEGVIQWADGSEPRELEGGTVEFESGGKVVAQTGLIGDGTFILAKALPADSYRVRVSSPPGAAKTPLDSRFEHFETSGLTYTAPAGSEPQRATFKLSKRSR